MTKLILPDVRGAFLTLFEAKTVNGEGDPSYSGVFILDPKKHAAAIKALDAGLLAVAKEKWKEKGPALLAELVKKGKVCFNKGPKTTADGDPYDGFEGMFHVSTRAKESQRPTVIDRDKTPLTAKDGRPYSGCFVNANIELWAQDNKFGKRINAQLRGVQFVRDGDSFGGGSPASADEFEDLGAGAEAEDIS